MATVSYQHRKTGHEDSKLSLTHDKRLTSVWYEFRLGSYELKGRKEDARIKGWKSEKLNHKQATTSSYLFRKPAPHLKVEDPEEGTSCGNKMLLRNRWKAVSNNRSSHLGYLYAKWKFHFLIPTGRLAWEGVGKHP